MLKLGITLRLSVCDHFAIVGYKINIILTLTNCNIVHHLQILFIKSSNSKVLISVYTSV